MPKRRRSGIAGLFVESFRLGLAANQVIAMRLMKMATGGVDAGRESQLMITEKMEAAAEASIVAAQSVVTGQAHRAPVRALGAYQRRVKGNLRRLKKG